ncbi:hypothetical protein [Streptomyces sp. NPDC002553]
MRTGAAATFRPALHTADGIPVLRDTATLRTDRRRFVDQETWGGHRR